VISAWSLIDLPAPGALRIHGMDDENRPLKDQCVPGRQADCPIVGQRADAKTASVAGSQPWTPKSDWLPNTNDLEMQ